MNISVIICSHNPRADYLQRVLDALRVQTLPTRHWELLLVDNHSDQPLSEQFDLSWHPNGRQLTEPALGLTRARLRGITAARGKLLTFVDDDNVLSPDYLAVCGQIGEDFPFLGAWGGQLVPEFEIPPPDFARLDLALARSLDKISWSNIPFCYDSTPVGAGMCIRAEVANAYLTATGSSEVALALDRVGNRLTSCGDHDLAFTACDLGLGMGLFPALKLTHLIPQRRMDKQYFLRLVEGDSYSATLLRQRRGYPVSSPIPSLARRSMRLARRLLRQLRGQGFQSQVEAARERGIRRALADRDRPQT